MMGARVKIALFVAVLCALFASPVVAGGLKAPEPPDLSLDTPAISELAEPRCVEDAEHMRGEHMQMLDTWRNDVLRGGDTRYVSSSGQVYEKSLDDTCLRCHSNKEDFCDKCHAYSGVDPYCWECHDVAGMQP